MSAKNITVRPGVAKKVLIAAAESLERYAELSDKFTDCVPMVLGFGTPFDCALAPFDLVANSGQVCDDKKVVDRFGVGWMNAVRSFASCEGKGECFITLVRLLKMFERAGRSGFNLGVFVADYGYFRGVLTKCLYWHTSKVGGGSGGVMFDMVETSKNLLELEKKNRRALSAARNAELIAKGELTDDVICEKQVRYAVDHYKKGESINETLTRMLNAKEVDGFKIVGDVGFVGECIKDGCVIRNKSGSIERVHGFNSSNVWRRIYQRLLRALNDERKRNKKGQRKSRRKMA